MQSWADQPHASTAASNVAEFTVSELSAALRRTLEDGFSYVRVRGEVSGFKLHSSGHCYFSLKDEGACLDAVCWRATARRLPFKPEDGLEVVASGRITTYASRSKYQLVIEHLAPAGVGALMALLEERKKKLAAEGLFAPERKRPLPYLPEVIGIITSPTGAVIRDILHRLEERFPSRVLLWPVLVQGEQAAGQIATAIAGFNLLPRDGPVPRPDILIVARGGGSIEDLWAFNEEVVVRAAAMSGIPLVSAVGHETDTTLIDFAADRRAPTPTAAAELAVPVRSELVERVRELDMRLLQGVEREFRTLAQVVLGLARGLPEPLSLLGQATQRLDDLAERLPHAFAGRIERCRLSVARLGGELGSPVRLLQEAAHRLHRPAERMSYVLDGALRERTQTLRGLVARLSLQEVERRLPRRALELQGLAGRARRAMLRDVERGEERLHALERRLASVDYRAVLGRGFALVRDAEGQIVSRAEAARGCELLEIEFADGRVRTMPLGRSVRRSAGSGAEVAPGKQGTLL